MNRGRVYIWWPDARHTLGGYLTKEVAPLPGLTADTDGRFRLCNRLVRVANVGKVKLRDPASGEVSCIRIGNAQPDANGDFLFEAGRGGGRMDKAVAPEEDFRWRYIQASHFGEVNTYYHLHKISTYVDALLMQLGATSLPPVTAVVNAHDAVAGPNCELDGETRGMRSLAFQGGHYRLPSRRHSMPELHQVAPDGEIHLGPGRQLLDSGALVVLAGCRYRANASHNAGIIYHEYGHHITRHTADFRANLFCAPDQQDNRKAALDEGICDYWAAAMLGTPHIWAWHKRHDNEHVHARSLTSLKTMDEFDPAPQADSHANGTIYAAALWDLRRRMKKEFSAGERRVDLLVLKSLVLIGNDLGEGGSARAARDARSSYSGALTKLLRADELINGGDFRDAILACFSARKIFPRQDHPIMHTGTVNGTIVAPVLLKHVSSDEIPPTRDILSAEQLGTHLEAFKESKYSLVGVGDVMLGDRSKRAIRQFGPDYPFEATLPLLTRSDIVLCNLEGPLATETKRVNRNFSYCVQPRHAASLARANINVVTLANNHLMDCGRDGVVETLNALANAGVQAVGAGVDEPDAHRPTVVNCGPLRLGILGYYWNRRCAATHKLPGSAVDTREHLQADIRRIREAVDRVVVTFHWGVPYERTPSEQDRAKARLAVDLGADLVIGHHPHVIQPIEIYGGRPIFYSVGNFAFGSGNSRAEGLMVGVRFEETETLLDVFPLYVKNRDPRVDYQPKVLSGSASRRILTHLAEISGASGAALKMEAIRGTLRLKRNREL
jgi:poly-gamma-glutamate capsule biosynthesis protein CapA/YwtB (metallophosphatase superfamily)